MPVTQQQPRLQQWAQNSPGLRMWLLLVGNVLGLGLLVCKIYLVGAAVTGAVGLFAYLTDRPEHKSQWMFYALLIILNLLLAYQR